MARSSNSAQDSSAFLSRSLPPADWSVVRLCGEIDMVIKDIDLEPKIDAMARDFFDPSRWKELSKKTSSEILSSGDGSCGVMERKRDNIHQMGSALEDLFKEYSVSAVIVGIRKDPFDNTELLEFLIDLRTKAGKFKSVPYAYWEEEDLFYKRVQCMQNPFYFDRRLAKMLRDRKYCASEMLQSYLNEMNKQHTMSEQVNEHHSRLE
ncbi:hypothetical protein Tco_0853819 [Tanacetum coccineum]